MSPSLTDRFTTALIYATTAHAGQTRKGTTVPYIAHCLAVAALALEAGCDEETAIAALLHDVVEDCVVEEGGGPPRLVEIREQFGDRVADIVSACSDTDQTPKPPWRARKQAWLDAFPRMSAPAQLVATCDKLHNARSMLSDLRQVGDALWSRFKGGRDGTLWYYETFIDLCRQSALPVALVDDLDRTVRELRRS
jgi:(p)ppGpp synthase/HD superfamily hydrolase